MIQRKLTFESLCPFVADEMRYQHGSDVWPSVDFDTIGPWSETLVEFTGDARMDQYNTLKEWAETKKQPIRNVRLLEREIPDDGWQEVKP